jgi:serine/threonine-protein kinase
MAGNPQVLGLLEEMLDSGKTPEEVCRDCPELLPEVRQRWQEFRRIDAQVGELLPGLRTPPLADTVPPGRPGAGLPQVAGYEMEAVLGHGGMGVVYVARHRALDRRVAVKMLLAGPFAGPQELVRFQRETTALACLRHPNIVQVYDAGEVEGRPYFAMELVEGGSLAQKLAGTPQPARSAAALLATLAEAMQVAHQGGIVHRDLKPGNILLTADGTPKIADFGLARRLEGGAGLTQSGVPMGTPNYMAPEQARGQTNIGPAVDVYALGAILYEVLTGRPPFQGETAAATMHQVIAHDPVPPSRLNFKVPRDLETICLKCLQKAPPHRYASAQTLADDLRRFGEGRPIQARPVSWGAQLWRWGRRNPTTAGLLATLLALFLVTVGAGLWFERQKFERQGRAQEAVEAALTQIPGLRQQGRWTEAEALLTQAKSRLDEAGSDDLRQRLAQAEADLQLAAALEQIRLTPAIDGNRFDYPSMAEAYAQAFEHAGLDVNGDNETVGARIRNSDLRPQLVMALDHWAYVADALRDGRTMARLLELARRADPDPQWGDRFRDPALWGDPKALRRLAGEVQEGLAGDAPANEPPTPLVTLLAKKLGDKDGQVEPLLRAAQERSPEDFWLNYALGEALRIRKPAEAVAYYRAALATRPTLAEVHSELGMALLRQGQVDEAIRVCRKASQLRPASAAAHNNLAMCLDARGELDEAIAEFSRVMDLSPTNAKAHHNLGLLWQRKGRFDEAMDEYRKAIELDSELPVAHVHLGTCLQARNRIDEAMDEYRRTIDLEPEGAVAHHQLGTCLQRRGQLDEAMDEFRKAIELDSKGAPAHYHLGTCQQARRRLDEAVAEFRRAVELDRSAGAGHASLAEALLRSGRFAEARAAIRNGLDVLPATEPAHQALREKLERCERLLVLDASLPALLRGKERPTAAKLVELARLCRDHGRPHATADLYALAFGAQPALLGDLQAGNRYDAASASARAAAGEGSDATWLGGPERADLRRQALAWLRADLELWTKLFQDGKSVDWALSYWQRDIDLRSVRDAVALTKLSADERASWQRLWADVAAVRDGDALGQGRTHAARRNWAAAADDYARALKRRPTDDGELWFEYASVLLLTGDRPGYVRACAHMIEACSKAGGPRAYHVARACTLAPEAVTEASLPGRLADKELQASAAAFWSLTEQGALHYRAGRFPQAVALFEQSLRADPKVGKAVLNWLWLALAQQRLGRSELARRWLDKATAWLDQYRDGMPDRAEEELGLHLHNWLEAHVLRREAEALIQPADPR